MADAPWTRNVPWIRTLVRGAIRAYLNTTAAGEAALNTTISSDTEDLVTPHNQLQLPFIPDVAIQ